MGKDFSRRRREESRKPPSSAGEVRWIGGTHAVVEAFRSKPQNVRELWVEHESKNQAVRDLLREFRAAGVRVQFMSRGEMDRAVGGGRHQGVAAKVFFAEGEGFNDFLRDLAEDQKKGMVLVALDQIQDPHNLGAIARSAVNLGARGLIIPERRSSPVSAAAIQASAGAIQKIPVFHVVNLSQALSRCKEAGFWIYGADAAGTSAWQAVINLPLVLVIGSEGYGMRSLVRTSCDELLSIPQSAAGVASLNASCAASVLLYEIARRRALPS